MYLNFHTHHSQNWKEEIVNLDALKPHFDGYFSYGIHPFSEEIMLDENVFLNEKCLAVGETGLDKRSTKPFPEQIKLFKQHVYFSEKYNLPLIIHCVNAWNELKKIKKDLKPTQKWIFHGFRKTVLLNEVLEEKLSIGIGPAILYDKKLQNALITLPLDGLMLETDTHVSDIAQIFQKVAEIKNINIDKLALEIEANFRKIFSRFK